MCTLTALLLLPALSSCVSVTYERADIVSKSKVELQHAFISCGLNDIAILTAPVVTAESHYYLQKPNQDIIKLTIPRPRNKPTSGLTVKYINRDIKTIYANDNTRVINPSYRHRSDEDVVREEELKMKENEFMIGPMMEEDHGNWVLSVYLKDIDDKWIEMFQVITVEITAHVPLVHEKLILMKGADLHLQFAYPIKNLESCELIVPKSTYDRFYDRSPIDLERCGYIVNNLTSSDEGLWQVFGVGKIVYSGKLFLRVDGEENISNEII